MEKTRYSCQCGVCKKNVVFEAPVEFIEAVNDINKRNECIQNLPGAGEVAPEYREMFISKICPTCWDKIFEGEA